MHGVATIRRLLQITGLFCKSAQLKRPYSAKEINKFKEPTNRILIVTPPDQERPRENKGDKVERKIRRLLKIVGLFCKR